MARSSVEQYDFRAGEWSPLAQGRANDPRYGSAMSLCQNSIPTEEGAVVRRPGTQRLAPTWGRQYARLLKFISSSRCAFIVEATAGNLQFYDGTKLVFTNDARTVTGSQLVGISGANSITLTLDANHGWSVGDHVMLSFPASMSIANEGTCRGQVFQLVSGTGTNVLSMKSDDGTNLAIQSANFVNNTTLVGASVYHVKHFTTPYTANDLLGLRLVQAQTQGVMLAGAQPPQALQVVEPTTNTSDPTFTFGALTCVDGPYLDPSGDTGTVSALTGTITFTASTTTPFASTDVGRAIRLFSQPAAWASGTTYSQGNNVTDVNGAWWTSLINSNTGNTPGQPVTVGGVQQLAWAPAPNAGSWAWGLITTFTSSSVVHVALDTTIPNMVLQTANGTTITEFQLGAFNSAVGFPTCGAYYEGRLYLFGTTPNRLDASVANGFNVTGLAANSWQFSPTDPYDNVLDDSGISEVLNSTEINTILWAQPDAQGLVIGTDSGEWLLSASALGDPITPTSIQIHRVTRYRSEAIEPAVAPMAMVFPQSYGRRIIEYLSDAFTQRYTGKPLNEDARHMTTLGIQRLDYQSEPTPILWAVANDGTLLGCTYRRVSRFVTENPTVFAWHRHAHGGGQINDLAVLPTQNGWGNDLVYLQVSDSFVGYAVEVLTPCREVEPLTSIRDGWFVDSSPGNGIQSGLTCGFLKPSLGISGIATTTGWGGPSLPTPNLPPAGTVIPPAPAPNFLGFQMLDNAPYLNGNSSMYNLIYNLPTSNAITISMWLWLDDFGDQGSIISTDWTENSGAGIGYGDYAIEINPYTTITTDPGFSVRDHLGGLSQGGGLAAGGAGQWVNFLYSDNGTSAASIYLNDTQIYSGGSLLPTGNVNFPMFCIGGSRNWLSFKKAPSAGAPKFSVGKVTTSKGTLVAGQHIAGTPPTLLTTIAVSQTNTVTFPIAPLTPAAPVDPNMGAGPAQPQSPDQDGLKAGIAEVYIGSAYIDFTNSANRAKFHCTDLSAIRYSPVSLGANGQLPTGSAPLVYLSGTRKQFVYNRAQNNLQIATVNATPSDGSLPLDPKQIFLDALPPYIQVLS